MNKLWWVLPAALAVAACGGSTQSTGSGGNVACSWNGACGGDNVGSWKLEGACILGTPTPPASCPTQTAVESAQVSGLLDYAADGTYTANIDLTTTETDHVPASCLAGVTDCASLESNYQATAIIKSVSCTGDPSKSCACTVVYENSGASSAKWSASGGTITITFSSGNTTTTNYCVQGNILSLYVPTPANDGTHGELVAKRQ